MRVRYHVGYLVIAPEFLAKVCRVCGRVRPVSSKARPWLGMEETGRVEHWDGNKQIRHLEASQSDGVRRHARRRMLAIGASMVRGGKYLADASWLNRVDSWLPATHLL